MYKKQLLAKQEIQFLSVTGELSLEMETDLEQLMEKIELLAHEFADKHKITARVDCN